jgi:antitoxin VapB
VSVNIKDERTHQLIKELAAATGESMTAAVRRAVEERLARVLRESSATKAKRRILAIGRDTAPRLKEPWKSGDHGDLLYDERGLPR